MAAHDPQPKSDQALNKVFVSMAGMGADEHGTAPPGAASQSVEAGHEPDKFNVKTILYIPGLVALIVVVGFTVTTVLFATIVGKAKPDANTDPQAAAIGTQSINERFARISSTDPNAPVPQPRLEYIKQVEESATDPTHYRSKRPIEYAGATYEIRPEDLRPENYIDPTLRRKILIETSYIDKEKKLVAIPIADAMVMMVEGHRFPIRKDPVIIAGVSDGRAKLSNSGRGGPSMPIATPVAKQADAHPPGH